MTAKEYLSQAFHIDQHINAKKAQVDALRDLASNTGVNYTDMPGSPSRVTDKMERTIIKIVDLENEIAAEIDKLVDLKVELTHCIKNIDDPDCRILLEMRYLCYKTWEDIAVEMNYTVRYVHLLHGKALKLVCVPSGEKLCG